MSLTAVDFDGTLRNPVVRVAVLICAIVLAAVLIWLLTVIRLAWQRVVLSIVVLGVGEAFSRDAALAMVAFFYRKTATGPIGVGFFGGPPSWAAPLIALSLVGLVALLAGRRPADRSGSAVPPN